MSARANKQIPAETVSGARAPPPALVSVALVDDDETLLPIVQMVVADAFGDRALVQQHTRACAALEALKFASRLPDLIILDLRLPDFDEDVPIFGPPPDLKQQTSDAFEIGTKLERDVATAGLSLYWMRVDDEILFDPETFSNLNLDRVRHRGIELSGACARSRESAG